MQHLSRPQLMSMALHFCRTQAEQRGFTDHVQEILALLEAGASGSASSAESGDAVTDRDIRNLRKTLARMSFFSLIQTNPINGDGYVQIRARDPGRRLLVGEVAVGTSLAIPTMAGREVDARAAAHVRVAPTPQAGV